MGVAFDKHNAIRAVTKASFYDFVLEFWPVICTDPFVPNWHIEYLCAELQQLAEDVKRRRPRKHDLVINVPPGSTKSTICSQLFNAWVWASGFPSARFISVSYAKELALKDAVRTRDVVLSDLYQTCFPEVELRQDTTAKGLFRTTSKGERFSTGTLGTVTGFHGDFIIIDDPLNPEAAYSEAELRQVNRWLKETISSRKTHKDITPTILIQQRLHEEDPSAQMLTREKARHICIPAELTDGANVQPPELLSRYQDGLLDPVRLSRPVLAEIRNDIGAYGYASQYLQSPVPLSGGLFQVDKLNLVAGAPPRMNKVYRSWDKAGTQDGGAWTVGVLIGQDLNRRYWVLDVVRGQWEAFAREEQIRQTAERDGPTVPVLVEVEGGSGGKESGRATALNLSGFQVILYHPTGDKVARATPFASQVGAGNVFVLHRHWTKDYVGELRFFPHGKFKDQVDASSGGFNRLQRGRIRVGGMQR